MQMWTTLNACLPNWNRWKVFKQTQKKEQEKSTDVDISGSYSTEKASSMPHEQRKVHAEKVSLTLSLFILLVIQISNNNYVFQVAKAFWMAIGGDDDEIDGLSSGEES